MQFSLRIAMRLLTIAVVIAIPASLLAAAAPAWAAENYTWTGEGGSLESEWSNLENWAGSPEPIFLQEAVGTLTFPMLTNEKCVLPPAATCYLGTNDLKGLAVHMLSIADATPEPYLINGEAITLGSGGISAAPSGGAGYGNAGLDLPVELGAPQTWSIEGQVGRDTGLYVKSVSGEGSALTAMMSNQASLDFSNAEVGPLSIVGLAPNPPSLPSFFGVGAVGQPGTLNATDGHAVTLTEVGAALNGTVGPLVTHNVSLEVGPFTGSLAVNGTAALDNNTTADFYISGSGATPGSAYTQLAATSTVELQSARIDLAIAEQSGKCPTLTAGAKYTFVQSAKSLSGIFTNAAPGALIGVGNVQPCSRQNLQAQITYTGNSVIATLVNPGGGVPVNQESPRISGNAVVGETLVATTGTWTGSPTSYGYQWLRCEREQHCSAIPGATAQTYSVQAGDVGRTLIVQETASNAYGTSAPTSSSETGIVSAPPPPSLVSPPSIQGNAVVGQTLTEVHGAWTGSPTSYGYQWLRCEREQHCSAIPGATSQTYGVQAADVGYTIIVQETASNAYGTSAPAASPETGIVPPLVTSGGGGGGSGGLGGGSGGLGGGSGFWMSSESSPIGGTTLPGGPVTGGTPITIMGSGFVSGETQVWFQLPGNPAAQVTVRSSTELVAITPDVPLAAAGAQTFVVYTPHILGAITYGHFHYFIPQIGTLVFRDQNWRAKNDHNAGEFEYCTGAVVNSRNGDVIMTAGHCVTTGTTWHEEVVFAPGYYGPFGDKCPIIHHSYGALCGVSPYGWWQARLLDASDEYRNDSPPFEDQLGNDYGVIAVQARQNEHLQQRVGGGLGIAFCQGSGGFLGHHSCDASYGSGEQNWVAYGEPNPEVGPVHCGPGLAIGSFYQHNKNGPENLKMEPCTALTNGSSGGPWVSSAGTVGAVNQGLLGDTVAGTYLGEGALKAFEMAQGGSYSQAISLTSQNVRLDSAGVALIAVSCPGPSLCRGTASLSSQASAAIASVKHAKRTVLLGHSRFTIRGGHASTIRMQVSKRIRSVLMRRHRALLATLMLRVARAGVIKLPVTLGR